MDAIPGVETAKRDGHDCRARREYDGMISVLISGAGVAGLAAAYWFDRFGADVTVVERAGALRTSGQNVDVRGAGREVIRRMGLDDRVAAASTGEVGTRFLDARGRTVAEFPAGTSDTDGATAEREILRGQLVATLDDAAGHRIERSYGDSITAVAQDDDGVRVTFRAGPPRRFDLLVIAEGIRSATRQLVFAGQVRIRDLGQYLAYGAIPRVAHDDAWWNWLPAGQGRAVMLRPDNVGMTRACLAFLGPPEQLEQLPPARQLARLRDVFADGPGEAPRILDALAADHSDFYVDRVAQIDVATWSAGRVVVLGDAAYCAAPVSGMGTSLALTGAYVLAGETTTGTDLAAGLRRYEQRMRPYVREAQHLPPGVPWIANPVSRTGLALLRTALRLAAARPAQTLGNLFSPPADAIELPLWPVRQR
ncbi:FAD-dependent monooxygenase [Actinoplanes sp. NPDC051859]|uniref:FAD-dependent monooxygenase n=1 Tax=Actinoplanes sp. NPDC051859 TaxID=3363909 RepID=UPI00379FF2B5